MQTSTTFARPLYSTSTAYVWSQTEPVISLYVEHGRAVYSVAIWVQASEEESVQVDEVVIFWLKLLILSRIRHRFLAATFMDPPDFKPSNTVAGELPPWEIAKAFAFHVVLAKVAEELDTPASELVCQRVDEYIAGQLSLQGGGRPQPRCVRKVIARCQDPAWYPGQRTEARKGAGRPPVYSEHVKHEVARVAMELKRKRIRPTPRRVRAKLPNLASNPDTGKRMSDKTVQVIFQTRCYDETEDDLWQYLPCPSQDALPESLKPLRVLCAKHILRNFSACSWYSFISIDPCYSLLPKTQDRLDGQQVKAMGKVKWMSKKSARKGVNLRQESFANTQGGSDVIRVDWTPVFVRGNVVIYIVDQAAAAEDPRLPSKLSDSANVAKFVRHVLPGILQRMKTKYNWADVPRTVVHDKASYFVTARHERLQIDFAESLRAERFRSWVGGEDGTESTKWLVKKLGDLYVHETLIAHIRRLLESDFATTHLFETPAQFGERMLKVERHLNSRDFAAPGGGGLLALAKETLGRCDELVRLKGERIPK
jgi:hypothetical protein